MKGLGFAEAQGQRLLWEAAGWFAMPRLAMPRYEQLTVPTGRTVAQQGMVKGGVRPGMNVSPILRPALHAHDYDFGLWGQPSCCWLVPRPVPARSTARESVKIAGLMVFPAYTAHAQPERAEHWHLKGPIR